MKYGARKKDAKPTLSCWREIYLRFLEEVQPTEVPVKARVNDTGRAWHPHNPEKEHNG
jgi:hypothetical protein